MDKRVVKITIITNTQLQLTVMYSDIKLMSTYLNCCKKADTVVSFFYKPLRFAMN